MSSKPSRRDLTSRSRATSLEPPASASMAPESPASPRKGSVNRPQKSKKSVSGADDSIVASLISSETQTELAPAIKSIFEQHRELEVIDSLGQVVEAKEKEIQKICETNFQVRGGFFESYFASALLNLRHFCTNGKFLLTVCLNLGSISHSGDNLNIKVFCFQVPQGFR
jgi:hypothetical protein